MSVGTATPARIAAVAGSFYPDDPGALRKLVSRQLDEAATRHPVPTIPRRPVGWLVPHAGLEYSGLVAAAAWRLLAAAPPEAPGATAPTVVILGTNHRAFWLDGLGAWDRGAWRTPLGDVAVDADLAAAIVALGSPFTIDLEAHVAEHSIEVQLPFVRVVVPGSRIVPLAVAAGTGRAALDAGARLGELLRGRRAAGEAAIVAISTDMAHYPSHRDAQWVTTELLQPIVELDASALASAEAGLRRRFIPNLACGMCGVEPAVVGLAALRAAGARRGIPLASATSADAGSPTDHTVGYLAVAFD